MTYRLRMIMIALAAALCSLELSAQANPEFKPVPARALPGDLPTDVRPSALPTETVATAPMLVVGSGDLLAVSVFDVPELSQAVRVSDTGDADFALMGSRRVAGKSTVEVQQIVEKGLREGNFILDPHVTVLIQEYGGQGVSISGEVNRPGKYPIVGSPSLLDVISMAGGFTPLADSRVTIRHKNSNDLVTVTVSSSDAKQSLDDDIILQPGDKILVPRSGVIYVLGDVGKPGGFAISDNGTMTLLQAVAFAQGPTNTAGLNETKIIRKDGTGYKVASIALKRVMEGKAQDVVLHPSDIVYVPNSIAKAARNKGAATIVQAAASLAIYAVR